jgi:putative Mg2+ transporter-C (MgtC) family protein
MTPWTFALNIGAALVMGLVIGLERPLRQHTAGMRTNALVALGAARFVRIEPEVRAVSWQPSAA